MQCDFGTRLNVKSISHMHDSIQNITKQCMQNCFQEYVYFDSFKGERDHSDHPDHSETLTTPTTRNKLNRNNELSGKNFLKQQFAKKVVCKDNLQSLKKKNHTVSLQEIVRKDKSFCNKGVLKNDLHCKKLAATKD